ncbi:hypothetical protein [Dysgonomonas massiliensis]|uniref:hypothetical protein n=1 Tax=Dysgonomonas massiliensis TaxID=2040292 RepID=UPI000C78CEE5|nr:hypothetical protein [Dysgonomonas massiliensis]
MKILLEKNDIKFIHLDDKTCIYFDGKLIYEYVFEKRLCVFLFESDKDSNITYLYLNENQMVIRYNSGEGEIYDFRSKYIETIPYDVDKPCIVSDLIVVMDFDYDAMLYISNLFNIKENELMFSEWLYENLFFLDNYLFSKQDQSIKLFNLEGTEIWQFSISDFPYYINHFGEERKPEIEQIIGIYNNILWVYASQNSFLGIDIVTGNLVYHIEDIPSFLGLQGDSRLGFSVYTIHLDQNAGVLKSFAFRYYFEVDLNTLTGKMKRDFGKWEDGWRINRSSFRQEEPNLLFFSGMYKLVDTTPNAFGIFDTEKAEIIWHETRKEGQGFFNKPIQVNEKLLAVLDDECNLIIYER